MLLHAETLTHLPVIEEPVVFDHFETFVCSHWDRVAVATPVGKDSWFVYGLQPAPHRRSGRVSPYQEKKRKQQKVPPPPPGQVTESTRWVLDLLAAKAPAEGQVHLISDGHKAYEQVLSKHPAALRFVHHIHPNPQRGPKGAPRSKEACQRDHVMFAVDLLHKLWRHSSASHKRKTFAFARRANAIVERGYLFAIWRNLIKGSSERRPDPSTPAMRLGLTDVPWTWQRVLSRRLFPARVVKPPGLMTLYRRNLVTPAVGINVQHTLKRAF